MTNIFLSTFHVLGIMLWLVGLSGYWIVRQQHGTRETELKRAVQRRKFDLFSLSGIVLWFASGMAMIVSYNYIGSGSLPSWLAVKFLLILILFVIALSVVGMDFGLVKKLRDMKQDDPESVEKAIGKLDKIINKLAMISVLLTVFIFVFVKLRFVFE